MELWNALLVPVFALGIATWFSTVDGWVAVGIVPCSTLLLLGGLYWRAAVARLRGDDAPMQRLLPWLDRLERPLAVGVVVALAATAWVWRPGGDAPAGTRWTLFVLAVMAALEHVNYFHRQLNHFDHGPDLQRLLSGRGFRRAHLARDLERHRRRSATAG